MILKFKPILRDLFQRVLNTNTRSFPFLVPPTLTPSPSSPPPNPLQCWDLDCAESQAHTKLVCNFCMWQFHRKTANTDQGVGDLSTYLPHSESAKSYFGLNVLLVFEFTLCENNLNFGKTKQYAIRQIKPQNWTEETKFSTNRWKVNKQKQQINGKSLARQGLPCWNESCDFENNTILQKKKTKTTFETEKWKNRREVRRRYPGPRHSITP